MRDAALGITLFVCALIANVRAAGTSPIIWLDTFVDEREVQRCLVDSDCTLTGVATSLPGQTHAVGWIEFRTLLEWLGLGIDATHFALQVMAALAAVMIFALTITRAGSLTGAAAAWILTAGIGAAGVRLTALYNSVPLLFLGAVFTMACTAVVERPGVTSVAVAALVGAVMANVHLACAITIISVVWAALLAPRRPFALAAIGAAVFALATFCIAPPSWVYNAAALRQRPAAHSLSMLPLPMNPVLFWTLFAGGAWLLSRSWPAPEWMAYRRRVRPAFIVVLPLLLAYFFSPLAGIPRSAKYLSHLKPACAFAAAYPLIAAIGALVRRIVGSARDTARERSAVRERGLALAVAVLIPLTATAAHEQTLTVSDLTRVARILREQHGWDLASQLDRLKTPAATTVLAGLQQLADAGGRGPSAAAGSADAALVLVPSEDLPQPLPPNWTLVPRWGRTPAVLAFAASAIDWNTFHVCRQPSGAPEPQCWQSHWPRERATTGIFGLPNMPLPGPGARGTLALRLSAKGSVSGLVSEIYMPRLPDVCGGYIASPSGGALQVSSDRRRAILATSDLAKDDAPAIELEWHIGSPECDEWVYDGTVPFFLEGDAPSVQPLEAVLRKMEG